MAGSRNSGSRAGGVLLAAAIVTGALVGILAGQPSVGLLAGAGVGVLLLLAFWLIDRRT